MPKIKGIKLEQVFEFRDFGGRANAYKALQRKLKRERAFGNEVEWYRDHERYIIITQIA